MYRIKKRFIRAAITASFIVSCTGSDRTFVQVEQNELGIVNVEIERSTEDGEKLLIVRGLDLAGAQIALATLRTGMVSYTPEPGVIPEEWNMGTDLMVTVGVYSMPLVTPGLVPFETREPPEQSVASFLRLAPVSNEILKEAGIQFTARPVIPAGSEAAYAAQNCSGTAFPTNVGGPTQCCRESTTGDTWHKINGGTADGHIGYRTYGNVCRNADGTTGCGQGGAACTFGPCGSRNMWGSNGRGGTTASKVFVPTSQPTVCGYQYYSDPTFGTVGSPETWVSQTQYASVAATCTCTACNLDGTAICTGSAYTYVKASNTAAQDLFAHSVALSRDGNTLAVGAPQEDSNAVGINGNASDNSATDAGAVYVYYRSGAVWSQQAYVKASNTNAADAFGGAVALSSDGNTMAVGAGGEQSIASGINGNQSDNSQDATGAVYVFTRSGTTWTQQAYIKQSWSQYSAANFGQSVALSHDGNTLAAGAPREDSTAIGINGAQQNWDADKSGAAYVFTRSGTVWTQQAYVKPSNTGLGDRFGKSVALSSNGSTMAVSALWEDSNATGVGGSQTDNTATDSGAVYVFTRSGTVWSQQAYIKASNTGAGDGFGGGDAIWNGPPVALAADGNTLVVGAPYEDSNATGINGNQADNSMTSAGAAYLYTRVGSTWSFQAYVKASNTRAGDEYGVSVALSDDGNVMVAGAHMQDGGVAGINGSPTDFTKTDSGAAYRYSRFGSTWTLDRFVKANYVIGFVGELGNAVAISGSGGRLALGAWLEKSAATGINGDWTNATAQFAGAAWIVD